MQCARFVNRNGLQVGNILKSGRFQPFREITTYNAIG
jgi:hypothetical protein